MQFPPGLMPRGWQLVGAPGGRGAAGGQERLQWDTKDPQLRGRGMTPRLRGALSLCSGRMREGVRASMWV